MKAKLSDTDNGVPGGMYTAVDLGNGKFNILDCPIFAELQVGSKKNEEDITKDWMDAAVGKAQTLREGGYMAPLHVNHHDVSVKTERAGFVFPKRVGKISYQGRDVWAVFADLMEVPAKVYERIKNRELPYRSVEVSRWSSPEINSMALLEDESPFFRFELLTIGRELKKQPSQAIRFEGQTSMVPAMATFAVGRGAAVLFKFGGEDVPKKEEKSEEKKDAKAKEADDDKVGVPELGHDTKPDEKPGDGKAVEQVQPVYLRCLKALQRNVTDMAAKIGHPVFDMEAFSALGELDAIPPPVKEPSSGFKPVDQPGGERSKFSEDKMADENGVKMAEQAGEIAALKASFKARERKDSINALVESAEKKLSGWHIDDDVKTEMVKFAEADDSGKLLDAFVARFQKSVPKDPPKRGELPGSPAPVQDSPEVMKFAAGGPDVLEKARKLSADYDIATQHGVPIRMGRERFIELNLKS